MKPQAFIFFFLLFAIASRAQSPAEIQQYIDTYKDIAIAEMKRTGVPASITLAQGIHETGAGQSDLVKASNNHFGIKCKADWQGEAVYHDDDAKGECFRKYADPADSYKDHSDFLKTRKNYAFLFTLDPLDYEGWAWGLKKAGYATNPKYPQILIKLITDYHLQDYTLVALGKQDAPTNEVWANKNTTTNAADSEVKPVTPPSVVYPPGVFKINETDVVFVPKGTSYLAIAEQYNISLARLFDFNDLPQSETAPADGLIFLRRKRKHGAHEFYTVQGAETVQQIAQAEGMRLESLLDYNFLKEGMQPAVGSVLYLQGKAPAMPKLATPKFMVTASVDTNDATADDTDRSDFIMHTVQPKETVYGISKKYAVTTDEILKWNNLDSTHLKTGQQLRINKKAVNATN